MKVKSHLTMMCCWWCRTWLLRFLLVTGLAETRGTTSSLLASAFSMQSPPPSPPEYVVAAQLKCFQSADIESAYERYFSDLAKDGTEGSWKTLAEEMNEESVFAPIINHSEAQVVMVVDHQDETCSCLVSVVSKKKQSATPLQYWWGMVLEEGRGWMVHSVLPDFETTEIEEEDEDGENGEDGPELVLYVDENGNILEDYDESNYDEDDDDYDDENGDGGGWLLKW